jgi:hypothetical protein
MCRAERLAQERPLVFGERGNPLAQRLALADGGDLVRECHGNNDLHVGPRHVADGLDAVGNASDERLLCLRGTAQTLAEQKLDRSDP